MTASSLSNLGRLFCFAYAGDCSALTADLPSWNYASTTLLGWYRTATESYL